MNKTVKWILIILAIIVVIVIIIFAIKYFLDQSSTNNAPVNNNNNTSNSLVDSLSSLLPNFIQNLFGGKKCDPARSCYQKNGDYNGECCQTSDGGQSFKCDCSRPGYTVAGEYKESCKEGRINYQIDCA